MDVIDDHITNGNLTFCDLLKSCDHAERRGFPASGRAKNAEKRTVFNLQIQVVYCIDAVLFSIALVIHLVQILQF